MIHVTMPRLLCQIVLTKLVKKKALRHQLMEEVVVATVELIRLR
jgi:hypothetical protein